MSLKTCKDCAAWQHNTYRDWHYCAQGQGDICPGNSKACKYFKSATVFQKITASPEMLAEKLVYAITYGCSVGAVKHWYSTLELGTYFSKKEEAIAATVERLNEVAE